MGRLFKGTTVTTDDGSTLHVDCTIYVGEEHVEVDSIDDVEIEDPGLCFRDPWELTPQREEWLRDRLEVQFEDEIHELHDEIDRERAEFLADAEREQRLIDGMDSADVMLAVAGVL